MKKLRALDLTLAAMFVALMAVGANITSFFPFMVVGTVPITLQTFFAILAGAVLGSRLGAIAMTVYMFVGLAGAPVFARFGCGLSTILSSNFGFILSFILAAYVIGKMVEKKKTITSFIFASLIGMIVNYVFGTNWMYMAFKVWAAAPEGFTYKVAWMWMLAPLPKDIILAIFAGIFAHRLDKSVLSKGQFKNLKNAS